MNEKMEIITSSLSVLSVIRIFVPRDFIPSNGTIIVENFVEGKTNNFRLLYPFLILMVYRFHETWYYALIMVIAIESVINLSTLFVDWMFKQRAR